jgi:hypothetical protein
MNQPRNELDELRARLRRSHEEIGELHMQNLELAELATNQARAIVALRSKYETDAPETIENRAARRARGQTKAGAS